MDTKILENAGFKLVEEASKGRYARYALGHLVVKIDRDNYTVYFASNEWEFYSTADLFSFFRMIKRTAEALEPTKAEVTQKAVLALKGKIDEAVNDFNLECGL